MLPVTAGLDGASPPHSLPSPTQNAGVSAPASLPHEVEAALWRGDQLGGPVAEVDEQVRLRAVVPELGRLDARRDHVAIVSAHRVTAKGGFEK